jgi:hypothetical protein
VVAVLSCRGQQRPLNSSVRCRGLALKMTWRNEQPSNEPAPKPAEPLSLKLCKALTFAFLAFAAVAVFSSATSLYSLRGCTPEKLLHIAWAEFRHLIAWPLLAAAVSFFVWRLLKGRSGSAT